MLDDALLNPFDQITKKLASLVCSLLQAKVKLCLTVQSLLT